MAFEKGRELPDWYLEQPVLQAGDEWYLEAFRDLNTTRSVGMGLGPIPWDRAREYGLYAGLDDANMPVFLAVMQAMDSLYLEWEGKEVKRRAAQGNGPTPGRKSR
jgi:hypothetical protein